MRRVMVVLLLIVAGHSAVAESNPNQVATWRQPASLVRVAGSSLIYVGNRRSGSISMLDGRRHRIVAERVVAKRIAALAALGRNSPNRLLIVDSAANELVLLQAKRTNLRRVAVSKVAAEPFDVAVCDGVVVVSSTWARQLTLFRVQADKLNRTGQVRLPFSPGEVIPIGNHRAVVADAFGGHLALIDTKTRVLVSSAQLQGHKLRGLALSRGGEHLWVPQQLLFANRYTSRESVHWGGVMKNVVRRVPIPDLAGGKVSRIAEAGDTSFLGYPDAAAGDPEAFVTTATGQQVIALAGVDEVMIRESGGAALRVAVGRRPTSLLLDRKEEHVWVANTSDDSLSLVRIKRPKVVATVALGPLRMVSLKEQGERLFYSAKLSSDGWFSCHSCHVDGHTNHRLNDNFGDLSTGAPKRVLSLLGAGKTGPWAWSGRVSSLQQQVKSSILNTMQGSAPSQHQLAALAGYIRTLPAPPSVSAARGKKSTAAVTRGKRLFEKLSCTNCHAPPTYTSTSRYDVGLSDQRGAKEFNPPSLLGVSQRARLFHDNRASSLREVLVRFRHGLERQLKTKEEQDLIEFLKSL